MDVRAVIIGSTWFAVMVIAMMYIGIGGITLGTNIACRIARFRCLHCHVRRRIRASGSPSATGQGEPFDQSVGADVNRAYRDEVDSQ